jgi:hypothetical protein
MTHLQTLLTALANWSITNVWDQLTTFANWSITHVLDQLPHFADCNLHFCIYGAFGLTFIMRAARCKPEHNPGEARENFVHGMVYLCLGLLK